ncbi:uncharacterized protein Z518_06474 [Rhinocladiella mackenziei CBS 650.93]|uniref:Uncharacterized protein n=1 Tax=Rhinocladiella mackenziei CBS 650.93 TaxID=1442369 RepID=A0A0D2FU18_9EURO|nr:uncharacterized protein Z518_06474 [Rhinocladiella mackenziei CBS 650.93]KIX05602.1 hypothetical protein Z518_06474 [Rhinocladiella mackenziei CBS 650.93]
MDGTTHVNGDSEVKESVQKFGIALTKIEAQNLACIPSRSLESRVAIITGAGALGFSIGNGRAAAILLAEAGANVICVDKDEKSATRTVQLIQHLKLRGSGVARTANVTNEHDCEGVVQFAMEKFGRLDILVNNVGIHGVKGTSLSVDMNQWATGMEVNVASMIMMAKFAIPAMILNNHEEGGRSRGSIVNIASVNGILGGSPDILYPTSKGAIVNMTRAMAAHHGESGIRVNCVCPGAVYTPMVGGVEGGMSQDVRQSRKKRSLLGVEGTGWDVGGAIRFLASDEAAWITGVILPVDAGATAAVGVGHNMGR